LDFSYAARQFLDFRLGIGSGDFARECFRLFGQGWNGIDGKGQCLAKPIPRNESAAARGLRASAGPSIYTIGLNSCGRSSSRVFSFDQFNFVGLDFLNALPDAERVGSILLPAQI